MVNGASVTLLVWRAARLSLMSNCGNPARQGRAEHGGGGDCGGDGYVSSWLRLP